MLLRLDALKECGLVIEENGELFLNVEQKKKEKRKNQRKDKVKDNIKYFNRQYANNPYANNSYFTRGGKMKNQTSPSDDALYNEEGRNCLPFVPGEETDCNRMIPLEELPENCRSVVDAWNRLRLKTFYGLYPALLAKVESLLQQYDTDTVVRGIAGVANSSFLLGRNSHKRFKITFCWLLDPGNFAKVLAGKYRDQFDEYDEWLDGEPLPSSLTGVAEDRIMTREERRQAVEELWNPRTQEKLEAARLLGLA